MLGSSSIYSLHINHRRPKFLFRAPIFRSGLAARSKKTAIPIRSVQNANCRLQTGYEMQTAHWVQNAHVWYVITCQLTTYRASRNRFSTIIFHDYLHCCAIFLARFLITIVHNITSNLHIVFSLCARVGWCDVCREVTNLMAFGILFILLTKMWTETKIFPST